MSEGGGRVLYVVVFLVLIGVAQGVTSLLGLSGFVATAIRIALPILVTPVAVGQIRNLMDD